MALLIFRVTILIVHQGRTLRRRGARRLQKLIGERDLVAVVGRIQLRLIHKRRLQHLNLRMGRVSVRPPAAAELTAAAGSVPIRRRISVHFRRRVPIHRNPIPIRRRRRRR